MSDTTQRIGLIKPEAQQLTATNRSLIYLWFSSVSFGIGILICLLLDPSAVFSHSGMSYYGNLRHTLLPYALGLSISAYFLLRAAHAMKHISAIPHSLCVSLEGISFAIFGIVLTPSLSPLQTVQDFHVLFGLFIYAALVLLSLHYLIHARGKPFDWILLIILLISVMIAGLSFHTVGILNLMLPAQVVAIGAFDTLLIRATTSRARQNTLIRQRYV